MGLRESDGDSDTFLSRSYVDDVTAAGLSSRCDACWCLFCCCCCIVVVVVIVVLQNENVVEDAATVLLP